MSNSFCVGCNKKHKDFNWKYRNYEDEEGKKSGWFCREYFKPTIKEWIPDKIKQDRVKYAKDLLQPRRKGQASKEFIEHYPEQAKKNFTEKEMKNAKYVWKNELKGL